MILTETMRDEDLVIRLKAGDHKAFATIYNRYKGPLFQHALRMLRNEEEAEDLLHELFTALWIRAANYDESVPLAAYLYRSIKNRVCNHIAYMKVRFNYVESLQNHIDSGKNITDDRLRERELSRIIEREVSLLPPQMKRIFELSRKVNMTHREIAELLSLSDNTIKKQISLAIRILRKKLQYIVFLMSAF
ncbi:RNA polymerase sigma factor [Pedobacter miscanthi]|uniref:RNA polymerase subunit sigma-70 n=1 Tax=Pedobacter miscanthi TaxID=2259170 RepID=A0A366LE59_9SPHI|nr:RNA polymerase sigma-70 factor [Pedobacter miscanthi]RBQ12060.1 RNA polymerase subunit sigma-70 [Pedobacter miscanthi]